MNCPRCAEAPPLEQRRASEQVLVDLCERCGGAWLDRGEVYAFVQQRQRLQLELGKAYKTLARAQESCPRCLKPMLRATIAEARLEFEVCADCGGTWFDRGELESLRRFLEPARPAADAGLPLPSPRPAGETALLLGLVLLVCGALAVAAAVVLRVAFPELF